MKKRFIPSNKEKAKLTGFRMYKDDIEKLEKIASKTKENKSEVVRGLINNQYAILFDKDVVRFNKMVKNIVSAMMKKADELEKEESESKEKSKQNIMKKAKGIT